MNSSIEVRTSRSERGSESGDGSSNRSSTASSYGGYGGAIKWDGSAGTEGELPHGVNTRGGIAVLDEDEEESSQSAGTNRASHSRGGVPRSGTVRDGAGNDDHSVGIAGWAAEQQDSNLRMRGHASSTGHAMGMPDVASLPDIIFDHAGVLSTPPGHEAEGTRWQLWADGSSVAVAAAAITSHPAHVVAKGGSTHAADRGPSGRRPFDGPAPSVAGLDKQRTHGGSGGAESGDKMAVHVLAEDTATTLETPMGHPRGSDGTGAPRRLAQVGSLSSLIATSSASSLDAVTEAEILRTFEDGGDGSGNAAAAGRRRRADDDTQLERNKIEEALFDELDAQFGTSSAVSLPSKVRSSVAACVRVAHALLRSSMLPHHV